jgi:hypothetical protein
MEGIAMINVTRQPENTWRKRLERDNLKGSTYLFQQGGIVNVASSADHQAVCIKVLGPPNREEPLDSYIGWGDVKATDIVELIFVMDNL